MISAKTQEKIAELKNRIQFLKARETENRRKVETRIKIIIGGFAVSRVPDFVDQILPSLSERDREIVAPWWAEQKALIAAREKSAKAADKLEGS